MKNQELMAAESTAPIRIVIEVEGPVLQKIKRRAELRDRLAKCYGDCAESEVEEYLGLADELGRYLSVLVECGFERKGVL